MNRAAVTIAVAVGLSASPPANAMTWQDVRSLCSESQPACWFYILGVIDAVRNAHQDRVCIPANVTQDTAVVVVDQFALRFPVQWPELQAYDFVYSALVATYPCGPGV